MEFLFRMMERFFTLDESPIGLRRWRLMVATAITLFSIHAMWAMGLGAFMGLEGFAQVSDLRKLESQVRQIRRAQIDKAILDLRQQQCSATQKRMFTDKLQLELEEFRAESGYRYQLPECGDF